MGPTQTLSPADIRAQLERILASTTFANSHRSQRFLRHVVESSLNDQEDSLKEYAIAVDVFERDITYDPSIDATVRVEAGRLRSRLRDYYADAGRDDRLIIEVPKGAYRATFAEREGANAEPGITRKGAAFDASGSGATAATSGNDSRRTTAGWRVLVGVAAAVLVIAAVSSIYLFRSGNRRSVSEGQGKIVLAVLPFSNKTGATTNDYLTEGLTDNLTRQLSELPGLRVVARTALDRVNRQSVAGELGVTVLLRGELQRDGKGRMVLNSELSSAKDGTVLRSNQYIPDESDLRPIQADIVHDVIQGLGIELNLQQSAGAQRPLTSSAGAFQAFLRGESAAQHATADSLHEAIRNYEDAVRQDTSFALGYASMAESHALLGLYFEPPREHMPVARQLAEHALRLDSTLHQAHGTLGLIHLMYDWDYAAAQNELAAADTRENAIWSLGCTAHLLFQSGQTRHAEEDLQRMLEFDPHSAALIGELGCVKYYAGQWEDSIRYYREALASDPQSLVAYWGLGRSLARQGRYKEALEALRGFKAVTGFEPPVISAEIGYCEALSGARQSALKTIAHLQEESKHTFVDPYFIAIIYLALKDNQRTYDWLNKAYDARSSFLISTSTDPRWSNSLGDPRFQDLWNRMTLGREEASLPSSSGGY